MPLVIILGAFVILCVIYAWATPPLEASDELWHAGMIDTIADTGELPVQVPGVKTAYEQEGSQPPLYYLVAAWLVRGIDRSDFDTIRQANPHAVAGVPGYVGNKNLVLHDSMNPPLQQSLLAIYVVRLLSIVCGCVTVTATYATARAVGVWLPTLPILAAGLVAFNPMFLFISASVNNDNLVTALNSVVIWQMVLLVRESKFSLKRIGVIALFLALGSLTKLSGLVLMPFVLLAAIWVLVRPLLYSIQTKIINWRALDWQGFFTFAAVTGVVWLIVAGWWYWRNVTLYGELFGTQTMVAVAGPRIGGFTLQTLVDEFQGFRFAYWALFGAVNIMTFRWFYDVMDVLSVISLLGLLVAGITMWRGRSNWGLKLRDWKWLDTWIISVLFVLIVMAGTISVAAWTSQTYASQGRLLFPFNAAMSILAAMGLISFWRVLEFAFPNLRSRRNGHYVLIGLFGSFALVVPFASIRPEYAKPLPIEGLPSTARSVYARFGDFALVGYETADKRYFPGDTLDVTVYWQVIQSSPGDYSLYLHATLDDGSVIGKVDSYPGAGRLRTSMWQAGAIYADRYAIPLDAISEVVSRLRIQVGWWDFTSKNLVEAVDVNNQPLVSVMLDAGGFAPVNINQYIEGLLPIEGVEFGSLAALDGYRLDNDLLTLSWEAVGILPANYTIFVQALDVNNVLVGQGDAPPSLPTRYFRIGEHFITQHKITAERPIPMGQYRIVLGWYNPTDLTRLAFGQPDNAYTLPEMLIVP